MDLQVDGEEAQGHLGCFLFVHSFWDCTLAMQCLELIEFIQVGTDEQSNETYTIFESESFSSSFLSNKIAFFKLNFI